MSDPTAPVEGAPAAETTTETSGPDYAPVMDRLTELAGSVGQLQEGFQQFQQANQPPAEAEPDPWTALFGEPEPQPEATPAQQALTPEALQQAFQQAQQQANAPLMQEIQALRMERSREQLYEQIPQLKDPAVAQKTVEGMHTFLREAGAPPEMAGWMTNNPSAIAMYFKAAEAENAARAQVPAGGEVPTLEAAGGAHPGGNGEQPNPVDQIFASRAQALPKGFA